MSSAKFMQTFETRCIWLDNGYWCVKKLGSNAATFSSRDVINWQRGRVDGRRTATNDTSTLLNVSFIMIHNFPFLNHRSIHVTNVSLSVHTTRSISLLLSTPSLCKIGFFEKDQLCKCWKSGDLLQMARWARLTVTYTIISPTTATNTRHTVFHNLLMTRVVLVSLVVIYCGSKFVSMVQEGSCYQSVWLCKEMCHKNKPC